MTTELQKPDKWLDRKLERRALLKKAAIGGASLAVLYVAPKFTSAGSKPAYAQVTGPGGCTPGFWKTDTPPTDWLPTGFSENEPYDVIFNVAGFAAQLGGAGKTLQFVLGIGGGCPVNLARHSVAALLNASLGTLGVLTPADIIAATNAALLTGDCSGGGAIETQKDIFDVLNNAGCRDVDPLVSD